MIKMQLPRAKRPRRRHLWSGVHVDAHGKLQVCLVPGCTARIRPDNRTLFRSVELPSNVRRLLPRGSTATPKEPA